MVTSPHFRKAICRRETVLISSWYPVSTSPESSEHKASNEFECCMTIFVLASQEVDLVEPVG
jgi:hypothetical protein